MSMPLMQRASLSFMCCALLAAIPAIGSSTATPPAAAAAPPAAAHQSVLTDIHGVRRAIPDPPSRATVLIFLMHDCPIANSYAPEIGRIVRRYSSQGFTFYLVYVEQDIPTERIRKHMREFGLNAPAIQDTRRVLIGKTGATVTPEAAVITKEGKMVYRGRIDDRYLDFGKRRFAPQTRDLILALEAVQQGKPVKTARTKAVGCFIPDVPAKKPGGGN
jgi:hypothetical protein